ncbi:MAG: hypothetical protein U0531_21790 [Dehalococcoidia bacterium]
MATAGCSGTATACRAPLSSAQSGDLWTTSDIGMLKGLVQTRGRPRSAPGKRRCGAAPWDIRRPYIATGNVGRLLPETVLGRASAPAAAVVAGS